jgi:hypothetical protein
MRKRHKFTSKRRRMMKERMNSRRRNLIIDIVLTDDPMILDWLCRSATSPERPTDILDQVAELLPSSR